MKKVRPNFTSRQVTKIQNTYDIPDSNPLFIETFTDLIREIAVLSKINPTQMIFFRGQVNDFLNKENKSTLYPTIYRGENLNRAEVEARFEVLKFAESQIINALDFSLKQSYDDIKKKKFIRWALLQHYDVCSTPFLDVTHSLRVASSFALHDNDSEYGYIYAIGLPYPNSRISMDSENELVNVRLLSICPPEALRPHFQEGYVVSTLDIETNYDNKSELDFNKRLLMKICIPNDKKFWNRGSAIIPKALLYPNKDDSVYKALLEIKEFSNQMARPGKIGEFINIWVVIENELERKAWPNKNKNYSIGKTIQKLLDENYFDNTLANKIDSIRNIRNKIVHRSVELDNNYIINSINELKNIANELYIDIGSITKDLE